MPEKPTPLSAYQSPKPGSLSHEILARVKGPDLEKARQEALGTLEEVWAQHGVPQGDIDRNKKMILGADHIGTAYALDTALRLRSNPTKTTPKPGEPSVG